VQRRVFNGEGSTERKQGLMAREQIDGGCSAPPPCTSRSSNGGRSLQERGGARSQRSDDSKGERKREEWGSVAVRVCFSWVSTGGFYRHGRARELGFPVACWGGAWPRARAKPGTAALGACRRGVVSATEYCGHALASSRRSASCREQRDREGGSGRVLPPLLHVSRLGSGQRGLGSTKETPQAWLQGSSEGEQRWLQ
jgi:hypothetical protein